jgi:hypothetical protein
VLDKTAETTGLDPAGLCPHCPPALPIGRSNSRRTPSEPDSSCPTLVFCGLAIRDSRETDRERQWPDYERCLLSAPRSTAGNGPDRSLADYFYCKMAAQRGWSVEETEQKLLEVSEKSQGARQMR